MRKISCTYALIIAVAAGALFLWSIFAQEHGYTVASAMLTGSAGYAYVRGPGITPQPAH